MENIRLGFAFCGSFCTFERVLRVMEQMKADGYDIYPIMSETASATDTRFGTAESFIHRIENICGRKIINTVKAAEPIGPKKMLDVLVVAPCTGNTLAKLSCGIADSAVTLAVKAHLRNERPVIVGVSSNDSLAANAGNIGVLLARRNMYFVPMKQDDAMGKPRSIVAEMELIPDTVRAALEGTQIQPILV